LPVPLFSVFASSLRRVRHLLSLPFCPFSPFLLFFFFTVRRPPTSTLFPYTTLFRSHPDRMASRILGMGDMLTLIEKAQQDYDAKEAEKMAEKMRENTFDFNDFIDQMEQVQKMGPLDQIIKMIPGLGNNPALKNIQIPEKQIDHIKAI